MHNRRLAEFRALGGRNEMISEISLSAPVSEIISTTTELSEGLTQNVVFDLSILPKRFLFPILKFLLRTPTIENLLVTYSIPEGYPDDALSENFEDWRSLPLFGGAAPESLPDLLIVNVGHLPMGLPDQVLSTGRE